MHPLARLTVLVSGLLVASLGATPAAAQSFTILQVNDVYRIEGLRNGQVGGLARLRALRRKLEAEKKAVLLLHAGDLLFPSLMSKHFKGRQMIDALNLLDGKPGPDSGAAELDPNLLVAFGNHEFDMNDGGALITDRVRDSAFNWITSNVDFNAGGTKTPLSTYLNRQTGRANTHDTIMYTLGGVKVGVLAVTTNMQPQPYLDYKYASGRIEQLFPLVKQRIGRLRADGARVVIALTHLDIAEDRALAAHFQDASEGVIDLIVGGHEHEYSQETVGRVLITKADADAKSAVVIDVNVPASGAPAVAAERVLLTDPQPWERTYERDVAYVKGWVDSYLGRLAEMIVSDARSRDPASTYDPLAPVDNGRVLVELIGNEKAIRSEEASLGDLIADAVRDALKTDIAVINGGGLRLNDDLPVGAELRGIDLDATFYYGDEKVVKFELTGQQIIDMLDVAVSRIHIGHGAFLQVSGLAFAFEVTNPRSPDPAYKVTRVTIGGAEIDRARRYTVAAREHTRANACSDDLKFRFCAAGSVSGPPALAEGKVRAATEAYIKKNGVRPSVGGRITRVDK